MIMEEIDLTLIIHHMENETLIPFTEAQSIQ